MNISGLRCRQLLEECYILASQSPDPSNQNGAVLIYSEHGQIAARGLNDFPPGLNPTKEQIHDRDWKIEHIEHAERYVIYNAAAGGRQTFQMIMVCPWAPCAECARAIKLSGIKELITHKKRLAMTPDRWKHSVEKGINILIKGGVKYSEYEGDVPNAPPIIVNGETWQP